MFKALQELTQKSTLLISLSTEGELLRLNISPAPSDEKTTPALKPLSLLGTAEEFDAGLVGAIAVWQAPRKSLAEQAQDAGGADDDDSPADNKKVTAKAASPKAKTPKEPKNKAAAAPAPTPATLGNAVMQPGKPWPFPTGAGEGASTAPQTAGTANPPATQGDESTADHAAAQEDDSSDQSPSPQPETPAAGPVPASDDFTLDLY